MSPEWQIALGLIGPALGALIAVVGLFLNKWLPQVRPADERANDSVRADAEQGQALAAALSAAVARIEQLEKRVAASETRAVKAETEAALARASAAEAEQAHEDCEERVRVLTEKYERRVAELTARIDRLERNGGH